MLVLVIWAILNVDVVDCVEVLDVVDCVVIAPTLGGGGLEGEGLAGLGGVCAVN